MVRIWFLRAALLAGSLLTARPVSLTALPANRLHIFLPGETVHNSHYLAASFLYQLQTLLGTQQSSPKVLQGRIVHRNGKDLYLDMDQVPAPAASILRRLASSDGEISLDALSGYTGKSYYEMTRPAASLGVFLALHPYRDNPNWLAVPVDSATFHRRRVLHIEKDRIAEALVSYFDNGDRLIYPNGTVIAAESFGKKGGFVEAEVLVKRADTHWNFSVYGPNGNLLPGSVLFSDEGDPLPGQTGFRVPADCSMCHRLDRLDLSGNPEAPERVPVRAFFQKLPARVPEIHLGPEYYDHAAFTELTESNAKQKDAVFGVYGSLLLSELAGRKKLGTLTSDDKARYERLRPYYPELLTPIDRIDSLTNSIGLRLIRIPASEYRVTIGSPAADPEHRPDEQAHPAALLKGFFMGVYKVTNGQFRKFRPDHHIAPYRGLSLDADDQPAVDVTYDDAQAFVDWLNHLASERAAGRTYRLPTEEEWEYAAQSGDGRRFPWGDQWPPPEGSGNFADEASGAKLRWEYLHGYKDSFPGTSPVGRFYPNAFFLYDMAGNAYEWTSSFYDRYPNAPNGARPYGRQLRVARGSSWGDELPKVLRCAFRNPLPPGSRMPFLGFRVVAGIPALH